MLSLDDKQKVEHASVEFGIVFMLEHIEEVFGNTEILFWMTNVEATSLHRVAIDVVSISHDSWELGNKLYRLAHEVVARNIIGIRVEGVHFEHTTSQDVHDVSTLEVDDVYDGTMVERHIIVEQLAEGSKLFLVRQIA